MLGEESTPPQFVHRQYPDTNFDSICTKCFATVGRSPDEAGLRASERSHRCSNVIRFPSEEQTRANSS